MNFQTTSSLPVEMRREAMKSYLERNQVELVSREFEELVNVEDLFAKKAKKRHSMNLYGNMKHLHHVRSLMNGTEIYYCYVPLLHKVHRFSEKIKQVLPSTFQKYLFNETLNPALKPFRQFFLNAFPDHKQSRESFASMLLVLYDQSNASLIGPEFQFEMPEFLLHECSPSSSPSPSESESFSPSEFGFGSYPSPPLSSSSSSSSSIESSPSAMPSSPASSSFFFCSSPPPSSPCFTTCVSSPPSSSSASASRPFNSGEDQSAEISIESSKESMIGTESWNAMTLSEMEEIECSFAQESTTPAAAAAAAGILGVGDWEEENSSSVLFQDPMKKNEEQEAIENLLMIDETFFSQPVPYFTDFTFLP